MSLHKKPLASNAKQEVRPLIYVSRYSNPGLKGGGYTAVRISTGAPRWNVGYPIAGSIKALMPVGLFNNPAYEEKHKFQQAYFDRLNREGVARIRSALEVFTAMGPDVVLLCFEDVRQPGNWCHRTMFAKWWQKHTYEVVEELPDPTPPPIKPYVSKSIHQPSQEQLKLF